MPFNSQKDRFIPMRKADELDKLEHFGIVTLNNHAYALVPLQQGLNILDKNWDQRFKFG